MTSHAETQQQAVGRAWLPVESLELLAAAGLRLTLRPPTLHVSAAAQWDTSCMRVSLFTVKLQLL